MLKSKIYLDNNAATAVDPRVIEKMMTYLKEYAGNPSSTHSWGRSARSHLTASRDKIASVLGVKSNEIIFTSGGTEGINLLLRGIPKGHIITSDREHAAVYNTVKYLETKGWQATYIHGSITAENVKSAIRSDTQLIFLMSVNNETGIKTDITAISEVAQEFNIPFFVDAISQFGKDKIVIPSGVSALCFSGQKFHAPQGTGFVFVRNKLKLDPLFSGAEHEFGRRAGTENLPGIVALAEAVTLINPAHFKQMEQLRNHFESELLKMLPIHINGKEEPRICNTSNISFEGMDGETLLTALDMAGIAASHGSACSSGALEPSRVLKNMDLPSSRIDSAIRFSLSRFTTLEEINDTLRVIKNLILN